MIGKIISRLALASVACLVIAPASYAQEKLDLSDGQAWTHSHSGITVPFELAGLERSSATAFAPDQLNTGIAYSKDGDVLSVYVYRDTSAGVPVWFEQARYGIEQGEIFRAARLVGAVEPFTLPERDNPTALKATYALPEGLPIKSTGLMLFSLGEWYVKVRATSQELDAAGLEGWMMRTVRELGLPGNLDDGPAVQPVTDCETPLAFDKEAKDAPKDGAADLLGGVIGLAVKEKGSKQDPGVSSDRSIAWCRDSTLGNNQTLYRPDASTERYFLAAGDSGSGISVGRDSAADLLGESDPERAPRYVATMHLADRNISYVAQDRLPSPRRVVELLQGKRTTTTVSTWGDDSSIEINADEM